MIDSMAENLRDMLFMESLERIQSVPCEHKGRLMTAVNLLIRDQEGKYDECLVENFFDFLANGEHNIGSIALRVLLEIYADTEFASKNQSRLFRFQRAYYEYYLPMAISITKSSECLWSRLPQVINKNDPPEIKAALSLLISIVNGRSTFGWIIHKQFDEPIQSGRIKDIVSLARYFLTTGKNYHIQNLACTLLADLIKQSSKRHISTSHRFFRSLKQHIEELIELGCQGIYYVLNEALVNERFSPFIVDQLGLEEVLKRSLEAVLTKQNQADVINVSKCLALARIEEDILVDKLHDAGYLGAIITYATHMHRDFFCHTWLLHYLIYPVLTHCDGDETEELIGRLIMTRSEKQFIQRHMQDKYVTQCLQYLKRSLSIKERHIDDAMGRQPKRVFILVLDVLLEFLKRNYNKIDKEYKNLLECCVILRSVQERFTRRSETMWLYKLMDNLLDLIETFENEVTTCRQVTLVLEIIRLMSFSMRKLTIFQSSNFYNKTHTYRKRLVKFARQVTHLEILEEVAALFNKCDYDFHAEPTSNHEYVEMIWSHMYRLALENQDHDLVASVAILLPLIDLRASQETMNQLGMIRYETVPKLLGEILNDLATGDKSIEYISKSINSNYARNSRESLPQFRDFYERAGSYASYVSILCKSTSEDRLQHLARAICVAIRRDLYHTFQSALLKSLCTIVEEYAQPKQNTLELLIRTKILETFYYIHETTSYTRQLRLTVCETIRSLEFYKTKPVNTIINLLKEDDPNDIWRQERASELVNFYCGIRHGKCESLTGDHPLSRDNKLDMDAYVDQILNQIDTISFDCY